jgi:hypothetical protein
MKEAFKRERKREKRERKRGGEREADGGGERKERDGTSTIFAWVEYRGWDDTQ